MECPKCKLINPPGALCCECGFVFSPEATSSPEGDPPVLRAATAASMGRRLGAVLLDCLPVFIIAFLAEGVVVAVSGDPVDPVTFALAGTLLWFVYMTVSQAATHNTLGKYLLGIQVVDYSSRSTHASVRQVVIRETIGRIVSSPLCMGYLTAFQEPFNQAWSDRIANTAVVVRPTDERIRGRLIAGLLIGVALCPLAVVFVRQIHPSSRRSERQLAELRQEADRGDASAMYNMGYSYEHGIDAPIDYSEAMKWYRRAADHGYAEAMHDIGMMFEKGVGRPVDYAEAMKWYREAAGRAGTGPMNNLYAPAAMSKIGYLYEHGLGVPQDREQAISWYRKAVEAGRDDDKENLRRLTRTP
jgi:uncharacterized RDD family membrane protein YckC